MAGSLTAARRKTLEYRLILCRLLLAVLLASAPWAASAPSAQPAPARLLAQGSQIEAGFFNRSLSLALALDRPVRFRVFTLDAPMRLVVDFEGLDPTGFDPGAVALPGLATGLAFGRIRPGWTRLVLGLARPMRLDSAEIDGTTLAIGLTRASPADFAAASGAPPGVWAGAAAAPAAAGAGPLILLDPGHGGIDPGALRDGIAEKDLVLAFARDLRQALLATGRFRVALTRDADDFVSLADRVGQVRADHPAAFLSLHVNAAEDPAVAGGIAFTLAPASTPAAAARAERENRADAVAGLSAFPIEDPVAQALGDLAAIESPARSDALARRLAAALGRVTTAEPQVQSADFQVLHAGASPAVLLELGFLSNETDRANLQSPAWRARAAAEIASALAAWTLSGALTGK
ncbi:MAG: N-acetylmuramoyl-L-alanine amidase [Amaricoccus sp.]